MVEITITGASDDLIEIDGAINEEFNWYPEDNVRAFIAVSDGTLLSVRYDEDGLWRFERLVEGRSAFVKVVGEVARDTNDIIRLTGDANQLQWVVFGQDKAIAKASS